MTPSDRDAYLAFFRAAGALKDTLRSGRTAAGRPESAAEHTWRLCLMAVALRETLPGIDLGKLLQLLVIHDLGEAVRGDVPAPEQAGDKAADERADLAALLAHLPAAPRSRLLALWDEYTALTTAESRLAKGLDRLETLLQHVQGANPPDFDYAFNLAYGRAHTDAHPITAALREPVDAETARLAGRAPTAWTSPADSPSLHAASSSRRSPMEGLERFVAVQDPVWPRVVAELTAGAKRSHWMWFIFPQIAGLGSSAMSQRYALGSLDEARAYLAHPVLGARLREATELMLGHAGRPAEAVLGGIDAVKFRSSVTLFQAAAPDDPRFARALDAFYGGMPDPRTLERIPAP